MIAYLTGETGADIVATILSNHVSTCYAHAINLCEVYYHCFRTAGEKKAKAAISFLEADGVVERRDIGTKFWQSVGELKVRGHIALADCFCIALAKELSGEIVTSDHKEFDPLVTLKVCPSIQFIR